MKLWLIKQDVNSGWDTYDSAIVAAETEDSARSINPDGIDGWSSKRLYKAWAYDQEQVTVSLIGEAAPQITEPGVILASFNAG